jgi:hypothetical protein
LAVGPLRICLEMCTTTLGGARSYSLACALVPPPLSAPPPFSLPLPSTLNTSRGNVVTVADHAGWPCSTAHPSPLMDTAWRSPRLRFDARHTSSHFDESTASQRMTLGPQQSSYPRLVACAFKPVNSLERPARYGWIPSLLWTMVRWSVASVVSFVDDTSARHLRPPGRQRDS